MTDRQRGWYEKIALGFVVAATGVGAGDVITGGIAGSKYGLALVWAALGGAAVKLFLAEGIARWQMATGTTILEGWTGRLGGFRVFQALMSFLTATMFVTVLATAVLLRPDWGQVFRSPLRPGLPPHAATWVLGVLGGVGGTVTLLSYSYWIREKGRAGRPGLRDCRLDLGVGYGLTGLFGAAMVLIGSRIVVEGEGAKVALALADQLGGVLGPPGRWVFLWGFWGAVFSSLLGVWQGVPYLAVDFLRLRRGGVASAGEADLTKTAAYRGYLAGLTFVPLHTLWFKVQQVQLVYAVLGALFMPFLSLTLLLLNNRKDWVGEFRNRRGLNAVLVLILGLFVFLGFREIVGTF
jgi:Mn2+/Fe2+ NRAMP family transporter